MVSFRINRYMMICGKKRFPSKTLSTFCRRSKLSCEGWTLGWTEFFVGFSIGTWRRKIILEGIVKRFFKIKYNLRSLNVRSLKSFRWSISTRIYISKGSSSNLIRKLNCGGNLLFSPEGWNETQYAILACEPEEFCHRYLVFRLYFLSVHSFLQLVFLVLFLKVWIKKVFPPFLGMFPRTLLLVAKWSRKSQPWLVDIGCTVHGIQWRSGLIKSNLCVCWIFWAPNLFFFVVEIFAFEA